MHQGFKLRPMDIPCLKKANRTSNSDKTPKSKNKNKILKQ